MPRWNPFFEDLSNFDIAGFILADLWYLKSLTFYLFAEKMSSNIRRNTRPQRALSAKEPSSEDIRSDTSSDDVQDENESSDDDDAIPGNEDVPGSEAIYKEVNRIKEELVQFQKEKIRYRFVCSSMKPGDEIKE